jgi:hypothetical protein
VGFLTSAEVFEDPTSFFTTLPTGNILVNSKNKEMRIFFTNEID